MEAPNRYAGIETAAAVRRRVNHWLLTPAQRAELARQGSRVGVTKPTIAARKKARRAKRHRTGR